MSRRDWAILALYAGWIALLAWHHEPWRDELQAWGLVRASASLGELFTNMRYEAHPPLWHLLLWPLARMTGDPAAMKGLAWAIGCGAVWLLLRCSPFGALQKALIAAGYMLAYEYAVVARGYGLGALAVFACCALWPGRHARPWALGLALGALALTSIYGVLLALAFLGALALEDQRTGVWRQAFRASPDSVGAGAGLALAGVVGAVLLVKPPEDFVPGGGTPLTLTPIAALSALARIGAAYAPVPSDMRNPWDSGFLGLEALAFALVALAATHALGLRGRPLAAAFFWGATGALAAFAFAVYPGGVRHLLHFQLAAIAAWWLAAHERPEPPAHAVGAGRWLAAALLAPPVAATLLIGAADLSRPFSNAAAAAALLRARGVDPAQVYAAPDFAANGVGVLLDRPIRLLPAGEPRRFVVWNRARFVGPQALYAPVRAALTTGRPVLLLTNHEIGEAEALALGGVPRLLGATTGALVADEDFRLYEVQLPQSSSAR